MRRASLALLLALLAGSIQGKTFCEPGFYPHSGNKGCYPCGAHALTCKSKTIPLTCESGFYVHSDKLGCYPCGDHANTCESKGKALTCASGYSVQDGLCKKAAAVTVTAGFAPVVTVVVTSTSVEAPQTNTVLATSTWTAAAQTVTSTTRVTGTLTESTTSTSTLTTTWVKSATATTTSTAISTVSAVSNVRNAQLVPYLGCYKTSQLTLTSLVAYFYVTLPTPYTLSTGLSACLSAIGASSTPSQYNGCAFDPTQIIAMWIPQVLSTFTPGGSDGDCDQVCSTDAGVVAQYGTEYCGAINFDYYSVYQVTGL